MRSPRIGKAEYFEIIVFIFHSSLTNRRQRTKDIRINEGVLDT